MTSQTQDKESVHFIGESHCLPFDGLVASHPSGAATFVGQTRFLRKFVASNVSDTHGELHPRLRDELALFKQSGLIEDTAPFKQPLLVLSFGDVEIHTRLLVRLAQTYDFELPQRPDLAIRENAEAVPCSTIMTFLEEILTPVQNGIRAMRRCGFEKIAVLGLPARAQSDQRASRWTRKIVCPLATRVKVTWLANAKLKSICKEENVHFVDTWNETSQLGVLDPEYDLDGVHMTAKAAQIAFEMTLDLVLNG